MGKPRARPRSRRWAGKANAGPRWWDIEVMNDIQVRRVAAALDGFQIELPSWGFANTGTRFGKFLQPAAATTTAEKFADAGEVHRWTGVCPTVALHVLWDLAKGV